MMPLRRLGSILAIAIVVGTHLGAPLIAQTPAQNDSAVKAAARSNALPLITPRKLSFTTDEASWISLDVSPDGKTLVFDILGNLYTLPIVGTLDE